jgi:hypothetical protein
VVSSIPAEIWNFIFDIVKEFDQISSNLFFFFFVFSGVQTGSAFFVSLSISSGVIALG